VRAHRHRPAVLACVWLLLGCPRGVDGPTHAPDTAAAPALPPCPASDPAGVAACVDQQRLLADLQAIVGPRPPGSVHHREVGSHCDTVLAELGFSIERERFATGVNVLGTLAGARADRVLIGAHYDHIPGCAGADDNASGVAAVLELARVLARKPWDRTLVVACWDDEESGLVGSRAHVAARTDSSPAIAVAFNFDGIGVARREPGTQAVPTGLGVLFPAAVAELHARGDRGDFIAVLTDHQAAVHARRFAAHAATLELPTTVLELSRLWITLPLAIDLRRSDHAPFWDAGIPAVMLSDTAEFRTPSYHCRSAPDTIDRLDLKFMRDVVAASAYAIAHALRDPATPPAD
jgi:Peptidase family M28